MNTPLQSVLAVSVALIAVTSTAQATVLTFDGIGNPDAHPAIPNDYGDRVTATTDINGYQYVVDADDFTPNIQVDYVGSAANPTFELWNGYGDLVSAMGDNDFGVPGEVVFTPDPGFAVRLNSFDIAGFGDNFPVLIQVLNGADEVLYSNSTTAPGVGHLSPLPSPITGATGDVLRLRIEDLGDTALDNINFSQVPEPAGASLLVLAAVGFGLRRKR